jgi:outer membrane scaffolding protein for murein synthesis (MipA/OmpV family)
MLSIASCLFWLPLLVPLAALAQIAPEDYTLIGAAVRSRPAYDGSDAQRTDLIPVLRYYGKPWFARTTQGILEGGARWALTPGVDAGVQLAYEEGRKSSESRTCSCAWD